MQRQSEQNAKMCNDDDTERDEQTNEHTRTRSQLRDCERKQMKMEWHAFVQK